MRSKWYGRLGAVALGLCVAVTPAFALEEWDESAIISDELVEEAGLEEWGESPVEDVSVWEEELGGFTAEEDFAEEAFSDSLVSFEADSLVEAGSSFVLMNIPYDRFYAAELGDGAAAVDAVTSATKNKPRTSTLAGGSFHVDPEGTDITGVIYPVLVSDAAMLSSYQEVTDASSVDITVTNRGQTTTSTYAGKDALFESAAYSYYKLAETPAFYKELRDDGSFSEVKGEAKVLEGATGEVAFDDHHVDVKIALTLPEGGVVQGDAVSGVILTDEAGMTYGLRHVVNIWRTTEVGFNAGELDLFGKTITNVRYITQNGVYDYPVSIKVTTPAYVLMNIPYDRFYEAELSEGAASVDAVTSATKSKPRTGTLAGGSFHVDPEGTDITGVIYPVLVSDETLLAGLTEVTDESLVDITVTNRGQTSTTTYAGKEALFESAVYSFYRLAEKPSRFKAAELKEDGWHFKAVSGRATTIEGATGEVAFDDHHVDVKIALTLPEGGVVQGDAVSGVILTDEAGMTYGLRHIVNIWRTTEVGFNEGELDLLGKTITNVRYITQEAVLDYPVSIQIQKPIELGQVTGARTGANVEKGTLKIYFDEVSGATDYEVSYREAGEENYKTELTGGKLQFTIKGLTEGTMMDVKVRAVAKDGEKDIYGEYSKEFHRWIIRPALTITKKKASR